MPRKRKDADSADNVTSVAAARGKKKNKHVNSNKVQTLAAEVISLETQLRRLDCAVPVDLASVVNRLNAPSTGHDRNDDSNTDSSDDLSSLVSHDDDHVDEVSRAGASVHVTCSVASSKKQQRSLHADKNVPLLGHTKGNTKNNRKIVKRVQTRELSQQVVYLRALLERTLAGRHRQKHADDNDDEFE